MMGNPPRADSASPTVDNSAMENLDLTGAVAHLKRGGIVVYPTGSVLAAGVLATDGAAVARLAALVARPADKPFGVVVADLDALAPLGLTLGEVEQRLADHFWPGALSLILTVPPESPLAATYLDATVAVRIPPHAVARGLARVVGGPVTATSANRSGRSPVTAAEGLGPWWREAGAHILPGEAGGLAPSTVVDCRTGEVEIVRPGRLPREVLVAALR